MSKEIFTVQEHIIPGSHIRELPNVLAVEEGTPEATLHLSVKHYTPKNINPQAGDVTIIALHGMTYTKEVYEPVWDDLVANLPEGLRIRGIWMVDVAQQGSSYVLNEHKLADGVSWDDHPRDVLHVINIFREHMVPPLMGIGHSMGGAQLLQLCKLHPRLFQSVAFIDPWFTSMIPLSPPNALWTRSMRRIITWKNVDEAQQYEQKLPVFKSWDKRCFDRYIETCLRETPTLLENQDSRVTPTTPAISSFNASRRVLSGPVDVNFETASRADRLAYPDWEHYDQSKWPYAGSQGVGYTQHLPNLRPRALFLYAKKGSMIRPEPRKHIMEVTGTQAGGSGGARVGCVEDDIVEGTHFFPFENPEGTAKRLAVWLQKEQNIWREEKAILEKRFGHGKSAKERQQFPPDFKKIAETWGGPDPSKVPSKL